jgi:NAD(P)-dependent dehydrogenase (short-subunit alcohol dehydrogenase family)
MRREEKFVAGLVAGAMALIAANRIARRRHAIDFAGRMVVITGGSRGLGLVMARQFAAEGAQLCLIARDEGELDRAKRMLEESYGASVLTCRCDVRRRADVHACATRIFDASPGVDVLVNNSGVIQVGPLEHMERQDFETAMATHFWGPLHMMMEIVPAMRRRGFGRIVNIASIGGRIAVPHLASYCASKFAVVGLSEAARAELGPHGIKVTTVCPGLMRTGSTMNAFMKGQHEAEYAWFAIAGSLPGLSMSAERAAAQIIDACRHGDPELTFPIVARIAVVTEAIAPGAVAQLMELVTRVLPGATGPEGDEARRGRESESRWAPSIATTLNDRAAVVNNEL